MPKASEAKEQSSKKTNASKTKAANISGMQAEKLTLASPTAMFLPVFGDGALTTQGEFLADNRFLPAQRQELASQIGLNQGNHLLHRIISAVKAADEPLSSELPVDSIPKVKESLPQDTIAGAWTEPPVEIGPQIYVNYDPDTRLVRFSGENASDYLIHGQGFYPAGGEINISRLRPSIISEVEHAWPQFRDFVATAAVESTEMEAEETEAMPGEEIEPSNEPVESVVRQIEDAAADWLERRPELRARGQRSFDRLVEITVQANGQIHQFLDDEVGDRLEEFRQGATGYLTNAGINVGSALTGAAAGTLVAGPVGTVVGGIVGFLWSQGLNSIQVAAQDIQVEAAASRTDFLSDDSLRGQSAIIRYVFGQMRIFDSINQAVGHIDEIFGRPSQARMEQQISSGSLGQEFSESGYARELRRLGNLSPGEQTEAAEATDLLVRYDRFLQELENLIERLSALTQEISARTAQVVEGVRIAYYRFIAGDRGLNLTAYFRANPNGFSLSQRFYTGSNPARYVEFIRGATWNRLREAHIPVTLRTSGRPFVTFQQDRDGRRTFRMIMDLYARGEFGALVPDAEVNIENTLYHSVHQYQMSPHYHPSDRHIARVVEEIWRVLEQTPIDQEVSVQY
jgi:hypothetical protein